MFIVVVVVVFTHLLSSFAQSYSYSIFASTSVYEYIRYYAIFIYINISILLTVAEQVCIDDSAFQLISASRL